MTGTGKLGLVCLVGLMDSSLALGETGLGVRALESSRAARTGAKFLSQEFKE